jgi:hypothetical protein
MVSREVKAMSNQVNPRDVWYMGYFSMSDDEKSAQLAKLIRRVNEEEPRTLKREASRYLKGVVLRQKSDPYLDRLIVHFETFVDQRGISGYITKTMACDAGIVPESYSASAWRSLMNRVMSKVPSLRKHTERAPFRKKMGTRPSLYLTDTCDVKRLYNARQEIFDSDNEKDAKTMVDLIMNTELFKSSRPGIQIRMVDIGPAVDNILFPEWGIKELSVFSRFVQQYLIPSLRVGEQDWSQQGPTLNRRV